MASDSSPIHEMLGALRMEGRETLRGGFTLDRDKAREKMSSFSLADPRSYVLELVQAAVLKQGALVRRQVKQSEGGGGLLAVDAPPLRFAIDSDDMHLRFAGEPFTVEDFDLIYASLFSGGVDRRSRARRQLALGLNAALALNPRYIRVVSGDAEGSAVLEMRPGKPDHFEAREAPAEGTHVHVKSRFRPGLMVQFYRNLAGTIAEEVLLDERCERSWYPVDLEGRQLAVGLGMPEAVHSVVIGSQGNLLGLVGFVQGSSVEATLKLYKNGVYIATHRPEDLPLGLVAAVDDVTLRKDVSQANVVVNDAYHEMLRRVAEAADVSLAEMGRSLLEVLSLVTVGGQSFAEQDLGPSAIWADPQRAWVWERLRDAMWRQQSLEALRDAVEPDLGWVLWQVPFWQSIDGRWWSPKHIVSECEDAEVGWTRKTYAEHLDPLDRLFVSDAPIVLYLPQDEDLAVLTLLFGERLVDQTRTLDLLLVREENRRLWRSRRASPELSALEGVHRYLTTGRERAHEARCQVGLPAERTDSFDLYCVVEGHLLCVQSLPGDTYGLMAGVVAVVEGDLEPNEQLDGVVPDEGLAQALGAVLRGLRVAFDRCAWGWSKSRLKGPPEDVDKVRKLREKFLRSEPAVRARMLDYLALVHDESFPEVFFATFDVEQPDLVAQLREEPGLWRPALEVDAEAAPYDRLPLFATVSGDWLSLVALRHWIEEDGEVRWVDRDQPQDPDCQARILWLSPTARLVLLAALGEEPLREDVVGYRIARSESVHLRKRPEAIRVEGSTSVQYVAHFHAGEVEGELALWNSILQPTGRWDVRLLRNHRPLEERRRILHLPVGRAVVNSDRLVPGQDWEQVLDGPALSDVWVFLRRAAQQLLLHVAKRLPEQPERIQDDDRELIRNGLRTWFPGALANVFALLRRRAGDDDRAVALYEALLLPLGAVELDTLVPLLEQALASGEDLPEPSQILAQLPEHSWPLDSTRGPLAMDYARRDGSRDVATGLGEPIPVDPAEEHPLRQLLKVKLIATNHNTNLSLRELMQRNRAGQPIHFLNHHWSDELETEETLLRVSGPELELLRNVLGEEGLQHGGNIVHEASRRKQFLARQAVEAVQLPPDVALVWMALDEDGIQGQVGLAVDPEAGSWIDLYQERRHVCRNAGFSKPGLVAVVNDDQLTVKRDYTYVDRDDRLHHVYQRCEALRVPLLQQLAERWDTVAPAARRAHSSWLVEHFAQTLEGPFPEDGALEDPGLSRLAEAPVLEGVGGGWHSLQDLRRELELTGAVHYLLSEREGEAADPSRVIVLANRKSALNLQRLFGSVRDYASQWDDDQVLVALRHHGASPLPPEDPEAGLVRSQFRVSPWEGYIYLPEDATTVLQIQLGVGGVEAIAWQPSLVFPCAGRFDTDKLRVYRRRQRGKVTEAQERILERHACSLYQRLAKQVRFKELAGLQLEAAQRYLRHAVQRLHLLVREDADEQLNRYWRNLHGRLLSQPLFPLASGELVSLQAALELRPPELAAYGLWGAADGEGIVGLNVGQNRVYPFELGGEPQEPLVPALNTTESVRSEEAPGEAAQAVLERMMDGLPGDDEAMGLVVLPDGRADDQAVAVAGAETEARQDVEQLEVLTAEQRLVRALREELQAQHTEENRLLDDVPLVSIKFARTATDCAATCDDWGVTLHRAHPVVQSLLDDAEEQPVLLSMLALGVYTAVNLHLDRVTDDHEAQFQHLLVQRLLSEK